MSRPLSWFPLAGSDPVPGDPGAVRASGERYNEIAEAIRRAAENLRSMTEIDDASSQAIDAVRSRAGSVAKEIDQAQGRYTVVGSALVRYASDLSEAQAASAAALVVAQSAQQAIDDASSDVRRAAVALNDAEDDERAARERALMRARAAVSAGDSALARARQQLEDAVAARDRAAQVAVDAIRGGTADGLGDTWWDDWGSKVAHAISDIAGTIAAVAGIASLLLGWVPVLGQALAAVALIAGAVALIADIALLIAGEGSWGDVVLGVVGVASFGIGRVVASAARAASSGASGAARLAAGVASATSPTVRAGQGLSTAPGSMSALRAMVGQDIAAMSRNAARASAGQNSAAAGWSGIREGLTTLKPSTVFRDLADDLTGVFTRAPGGQTWGGAFRTGAQDLVASAHHSPGAFVSVMTGNGQTFQALTALDAVVPELAAAVPRYAEALRVVGATNAAASVAFSGDVVLNGHSAVDWVGGLGEQSSAEKLGLR